MSLISLSLCTGIWYTCRMLGRVVQRLARYYQNLIDIWILHSLRQKWNTVNEKITLERFFSHMVSQNFANLISPEVQQSLLGDTSP